MYSPKPFANPEDTIIECDCLALDSDIDDVRFCKDIFFDAHLSHAKDYQLLHGLISEEAALVNCHMLARQVDFGQLESAEEVEASTQTIWIASKLNGLFCQKDQRQALLGGMIHAVAVNPSSIHRHHSALQIVVIRNDFYMEASIERGDRAGAFVIF